MAKEQSDYLAYLLRLWRANDKGKAVWRASLEAADTHDRAGFASLTKLFEFLREQTDEAVADKETDEKS